MRWYKSLYWRIAIGFVAFLAAMLVVQAMLFTWTIARSGQTLPGQSPARFAQTVAIDLANALERDPKLDVAHYVREQYAQVTHPFFVLLADERIVANSNEPIPDPLIRIARARLHRRPDWPDRPDAERFPRFGRGDGDRPDRDPTGFRFVRPVPIVVNGDIAGVVVVPPRASFGFLLSRFAPMLAFVAAGVLIVGTIGASVMIFGPARRRLRALESAARRFGGGDLSARAPERGGDEVAAVASAFNAMADDLAARAEALAASDRIRRQLLADVSHELTTPITAMRGYLETLTMPEVPLDEATRTRYLGIIGDETSRLERLIGDLLDLARLEGGGGAMRIEDVPVAHLFDRVIARHERGCADADVRITTSIDPDAARVRGDRDRLEQALQNLAANALRYAPRGTSVRLSSRPAGEGVAVSVEDEGPGIAPEHLPHVFDRFYKVDPSRPFDWAQVAASSVEGRAQSPADSGRGANGGGSGLGLSIVKAIVERNGGTLTVNSRPGRTVFEMILPQSDVGS
jgi:two-component system OmpR family sensor kinase